MGKRVAVIGASGFVGATLVEDSLKDGTIELVPVIHSSGNAWRLIRHGLSIRTADLLNRESVASALDGCTHTTTPAEAPKKCPPQNVTVSILASQATNPTATGQPRPVVVRLYQLKDDERLYGAAFEQMWH